MTISLITIGLVIIGVLFDKEEIEKQQGLTSYYDVATNGTIGYVYYVDGKPGIYLTDQVSYPKEPIVQLPVEKEITDISFSPNGKRLAYITNDKNQQESLKSEVYVIDLDTKNEHAHFVSDMLITEIEYDPKNPDTMYYLQAGTFENYSPIASARPHDYDVFGYQFSSQETKRYTNIKGYQISSLNVSSKDNSVYVQMMDDEGTETAEEYFSTHQRIFKIPLDQPNERYAVTNKDKQEDIYDFTLTSNEQTFIFSSVSNPEEGGTFEYELFSYDREKGEKKQLTALEEYTGNPVLGPNGDTIYFMVNKQFAQATADYHLYQMNLDGSNVREVTTVME
ncbi:TolB family protein [Paraliobacillus salinarum]|uniref:TolB family protein n=1 Tax=Paraliobacillus salinarum TaxID=1158996 RepID=UPI001C7147B6|nr:hypothetical protein [Paraliobacillus salinarum]